MNDLTVMLDSARTENERLRDALADAQARVEELEATASGRLDRIGQLSMTIEQLQEELRRMTDASRAGKGKSRAE